MTQSSELPADDAGYGRKKVAWRLIIASAVLAVGAIVWNYAIRDRNDIMPPLPTDRAEAIGRRVGVAFHDVEDSWSSWFQSREMGEPVPARLVLYTRTRPTPCTGALPATGPFYCPIDRVAAFDMVFLDALEARMQKEAELGTALVVARVLAGQVQETMGVPDAASGAPDSDFDRMHSLQADCLAGVWARMASERLGPVPPGFYSRLVNSARNVRADNKNGRIGGKDTLDPFDHSDREAREEAFRTGHATADPDACPSPIE